MSIAIERDGAIYTAKPYPKYLPNPVKFRWLIFRDGQQVGAARTKADVERRVQSGVYDSPPQPEGGAA